MIKSEKDYNYIREDLDEIMKDTRVSIRVRDIVSDLKIFQELIRANINLSVLLMLFDPA